MLQLESVLLFGVLVTTGRAFHQFNPQQQLYSTSRRPNLGISTVSKTSLPLKVASNFYNDFEGFDESEDEDDDEDDDEYLTLGSNQMDWRDFRRQLVLTNEQDSSSDDIFEGTGKSDDTSILTESKSSDRSKSKKKKNQRRISAENKELLKGQSQQLYQEFETVWAHETSTHEVGGLVVRLPLEVELQRNYKHSMAGARLKRQYSEQNDDGDNDENELNSELAVWFRRAHEMIDEELQSISEDATDGQIDVGTLSDEKAELLQLYLDQQESWQAVCLVVDVSETSSTTLVLNRPMAMQLTENLGQLVLYGAYQSEDSENGDVEEDDMFSPQSLLNFNPNDSPKRKGQRDQPDLNRFMKAFGSECAVYIGGPDNQDQPAEFIHGFADLPGSVEIAPNTGIYRGGLKAAVDGVLQGKYKPLDFRFFVGRCVYEDSTLGLSILLGKYQPVACARCLALKQCISLPKPLFYEVLELCGGSMSEIVQLEKEKSEDNSNVIKIEFDDDEDDDELDDITIIDELDQLSNFDDDEDTDDDEEDYYFRR